MLCIFNNTYGKFIEYLRVGSKHSQIITGGVDDSWKGGHPQLWGGPNLLKPEGWHYLGAHF